MNKKMLATIAGIIFVASVLFMIPTAHATDGNVTVTVQLLASDGITALGGTPQYQIPGDWQWWTFGGGTTTATMEMLPQGYNFKVHYNHASASTSQDVSANNVVTFRTGKVTLQFSGTIQYNVPPDWQWWAFTKPSMEFLPGTYQFKFNGYQTTITVTAGSVVEKTIASIQVLKSNGQGQPGATAKWWDWGVNQYYSAPGTTDSQGILVILMDGKHTNVLIQPTYEAATSPFINQNPTINSFFGPWKMVSVTVQLKDNTGAIIAGATPTVYYLSLIHI